MLRREPAIEFLRLRDVGRERCSDAEVLAFAAAEHWIVVSHGVSTMSAAAHARLAAGQPLSGLLLVHQLAPLPSAIDNLVLIWSASEAEEWQDQVWFLPQERCSVERGPERGRGSIGCYSVFRFRFFWMRPAGWR